MTQFWAIHLCWRQLSQIKSGILNWRDLHKDSSQLPKRSFPDISTQAKRNLANLFKFVKGHRMIPSVVVDLWLKGDANNLPAHILPPQISGDEFPLFLPLLLQPRIKCGQNNWDKGAVSLLDVFKMPYFIRIFNHFNSYAWNDRVYEQNSIKHCVPWAWDVGKIRKDIAVMYNGTQEREKKWPEIKNMLTLIIF